MVYQATDTRLGREVALKILPEKFVRDRQRMGRFQREAEVLASLNHPSISIIHGLEEADGVRALVLELVEGPTLAERIAQGPMPVEEALQIALEITQALEAAHEKGIIHRDLKPANVKITSEGTVKVLDFGLAKALETETSNQELANSPTLTLEATREGIVLGTAAYMSPEQARGRELDKRTDIWSFGLVLFEMLTGKGMYAGKSFNETIAAVIHQQPRLEELPNDTPSKIRELLGRCLRKDPRMRLRDMGDARITLDECLAEGATPPEEALVSASEPPLWRRLAPWAAIPFLAVLSLAVKPDSQVPEKPVTRFQVPLAEGEMVIHWHRHGLALSPDGTKLAFVAASRNFPSRIYIRSLDGWSVIPVSERVSGQPFFSPDGKWLGFHTWSKGFSEGKLKKVPLDGGPATTICDCRYAYGATWGEDDTIIFNCNNGWGEGGLWQVSASGGQPEEITKLDEEAAEVSHRLPDLLPGGKEVLYTLTRYQSSPDWRRAQIVVQSLETGERKLLIENGADARYLPPGHLVFAREATLMAVPFDLATLSVTGPEVPVLEGVSRSIRTGSPWRETGAAQFAVSASGSLAYIAGSVYLEDNNRLVWVDRKGAVEPMGLDRGPYHRGFLSPDGSTLAFTLRGDIWTYDLERRTKSKQTSKGRRNHSPVWTPDGTAISFSSDRTGPYNLFRKKVDSEQEAELLFSNRHDKMNGSWSPGGEHLAFCQMKSVTSSTPEWDIWILSFGDSPSATPFVETGSREMHPAFSPDGRWLAYCSEESGERQVYVKPFPGRGGDRVTISPDGGQSPVWSGDGSELFYRSTQNQRNMYSVEIEIEEGELRPGKPVVLFKSGSYNYSQPARSYDVTPNGQRFVMAQQMDLEELIAKYSEQYFGRKISVVLNWTEELKRMVPRGE